LSVKKRAYLELDREAESHALSAKKRTFLVREEKRKPCPWKTELILSVKRRAYLVQEKESIYLVLKEESLCPKPCRCEESLSLE
jgi:hypothetical protein